MFRNHIEGVPIACEVCGYLTMDAHKRGVGGICPVCFWEDDELHKNPDEPCDGANGGLSINQAKANYRKYDAVEKRLVKHVRRPYPEEMPSEQS